MEDMLTSLSTYGYIILFLYSFGGGFLALSAASVLSFTGQMNFEITLLVAFISNAIGDAVLFTVARNSKKDVMAYLKKHRRKLALSHILIKRHGSKVIVFQKFIYGVKTLVPLAIGLTNYNMRSFMIVNVFASMLWALVVGFISFYSAASIISIFENFEEHKFVFFGVLFSIFALIYYYFARVTKKRR